MRRFRLVTLLTVLLSTVLFPGQAHSVPEQEIEESLAFVRVTGESSSEIYLLEPDGGDPERLFVGEAGAIQPFDWSPDGGSIVFEKDGDIYVADVAGSKPRRLTSSARFDDIPSWSPDGSRIAFEGSSYGGYAETIRTIRPDGTDQRRVLRSQAEWFTEITWSPNSRWLAYSACSITCRIGRVRTNGRSDEGLAKGHGPAYSPDGKTIVFLKQFYRDDQPITKLFRMNANGTDRALLATVKGSSETPAWSPDGSKIAFHALFPDKVELWVVNLDGTEKQLLMMEAGLPAWSPDGTRIAFVRRTDGDGEIWSMNADGSDARQLTFNDVIDGYPQWRPTT